MAQEADITRSPRIGHGFDLHALEPCAPQGRGQAFRLCGVLLDHTHGPVAHSDGDAGLHAVTDALLGAIGAPDIGQLFDDADPRWKGANSDQFVSAAIEQVQQAGYRVGNLDLTIVCERPKIAQHKDGMRKHIANLLNVSPTLVNVKAKTNEGVDAIGEGRAVEVHAVVMLIPS